MQSCTLCAEIKITWAWVWATWNSSEEKFQNHNNHTLCVSMLKLLGHGFKSHEILWKRKLAQRFETLGQDPNHWTNHTKTRFFAPSPIYFGEIPKSVALPNVNYPLLHNALDYDTHELPEPPQQQYNRALCVPRPKITWPWVWVA